jgi:hypothetical protein
LAKPSGAARTFEDFKAPATDVKLSVSVRAAWGQKIQVLELFSHATRGVFEDSMRQEDSPSETGNPKALVNSTTSAISGQII